VRATGYEQTSAPLVSSVPTLFANASGGEEVLIPLAARRPTVALHGCLDPLSRWSNTRPLPHRHLQPTPPQCGSESTSQGEALPRKGDAPPLARRANCGPRFYLSPRSGDAFRSFRQNTLSL
jgi:hypothetical protein